MTTANHHFGLSNGSDNFYSHNPSLILYTESVKALADQCQAYWLIDLIISHQCKQEINNQRFQTWQLMRKKDTSYHIFATDGNDIIIVNQYIPYSDFPYDAATLWLVDGCLLLPAEY